MARLKMGRLTGEDAAEAYMAKMLVNFSSHKTRTNFYRAGPKPWGGISRGIQTKHFSALCKYISKIKDENEDERVAWLESRNIPRLDGRKLNETDALFQIKDGIEKGLQAPFQAEAIRTVTACGGEYLGVVLDRSKGSLLD